jgi:hypothetical protein
MTWTLLLGLATAGEPLWAGVPLASLDTLGVGAPTVSHRTSAWRAPLAGGGIVDVALFPTEEDAIRHAQARVYSSSQHALPPLGPDRWGAEGEILLVRDRNVVLFVRSQAGSADTAAAALQSALVVESTGPDWQTLTVGGVPLAWDACGNRRVVD